MLKLRRYINDQFDFSIRTFSNSLTAIPVQRVGIESVSLEKQKGNYSNFIIVITALKIEADFHALRL